MSDLRPNNGGGTPPDDGGATRGGLPDLPPEWGTIIIPDDAAELDAEAGAVRRELRHAALRSRLRRLAGLGPGRGAAPSIAVPIVIMAVAVITTLLSLFVVTWDHRRNATAPVGPEAGGPQGSVPLADVTLADSAGSLVTLGNLLPAVILIVEGCDCADLIGAVALAAPPIVTVVPVANQAPCAVGTAKNVRCLADPAGAVSGRYPTLVDMLAATDAPPTAVPAPSASSFSASVPAALAVPVDGDGSAHDPILVMAPADLSSALTTITATG